MSSVLDQERDWDWERRYYEKQRNCPHDEVKIEKYRWYPTCTNCGKRVDERS